MATLPSLRTGAPCQFPLQKQVSYRTAVLQFVDGQEQRFRKLKNPEIRWSLAMRDLDEQESAAQLRFFEGQQGAAQPMEFTDPITGQLYESCYLGDDRLDVQGSGEGRRSLTVVVVAH